LRWPNHCLHFDFPLHHLFPNKWSARTVSNTNPFSFSMIKRKNSAIVRPPRMLAFSDSTGGWEVMRYSLPGKVYLAGAGPGSATLLTVRALEVLRAADLVLHDDLVSDDVLACIPART